MKNKKIVAWSVVAAVLAVFLLGIVPMGNYAAFGANSAIVILVNIGLFFVAVMAAVVALYWGRR
jgi:hypothetical protein